MLDKRCSSQAAVNAQDVVVPSLSLDNAPPERDASAPDHDPGDDKRAAANADGSLASAAASQEEKDRKRVEHILDIRRRVFEPLSDNMFRGAHHLRSKAAARCLLPPIRYSLNSHCFPDVLPSAD